MVQEQLVELAVVDEILPLHRGVAVAGNDRVDVFDPGDGFANRLGVGDAAAPVVHVDERLALGGKHVARVHHARVAEDDERIAVGVGGAEVKEIDRLVALEQGHLVLERLVGQTVLLGRLLEGRHLLHVGAGVFLRDDFHAGGEEIVAARVVAVGMRVDDVGHRLVGDGLHLVEDRLPVVGELGVDEHHAGGGDEGRRIPALPRDCVEVVRNLLDRSDGRKSWSAPAPLSPVSSALAGRLLRAQPNGHRQPSSAQNDSEHGDASHDAPPSSEYDNPRAADYTTTVSTFVSAGGRC